MAASAQQFKQCVCLRLIEREGGKERGGEEGKRNMEKESSTYYLIWDQTIMTLFLLKIKNWNSPPTPNAEVAASAQ